MSDSSKPESEESVTFDRRASDRGDSDGGIQAGGRRYSDSRRTLPRSNAAKIAIACSFFFSTGLIAWAFTLPFRSGSLSNVSQHANLSNAERAKLEYEASLSPKAYVQYAEDIDRRLIDQVRNASLAQPARQSKRQLRRDWEKRMEKHRRQIEAIRKQIEAGDIQKGTIEWQNLKDLEKLVEDEPPEA